MFQAILGALKGLGGGIAKGIGLSHGLEFMKEPLSMVKAKSPITGKIGELATPRQQSIWEQVGQTLGSRVGGRKVGAPDIEAPGGSTSVLPRRPYQQPGGGQGIETLLEMLARRL